VVVLRAPRAAALRERAEALAVVVPRGLRHVVARVPRVAGAGRLRGMLLVVAVRARVGGLLQASVPVAVTRTVRVVQGVLSRAPATEMTAVTGRHGRLLLDSRTVRRAVTGGSPNLVALALPRVHNAVLTDPRIASLDVPPGDRPMAPKHVVPRVRLIVRISVRMLAAQTAARRDGLSGQVTAVLIAARLARRVAALIPGSPTGPEVIARVIPQHVTTVRTAVSGRTDGPLAVTLPNDRPGQELEATTPSALRARVVRMPRSITRQLAVHARAAGPRSRCPRTLT
jgi:hypothetical protein